MGDIALNVCFHGIGEPQRELEPGEDRYWITVDQYHRILDEVMGWPAISLSFDDGNRSDVEIGLPGLQQRDLTATFFPIAGRMDTSGSLQSVDVQLLSKQGMAIGTHGMWHRPWRGLSPAERTAELVEARSQLAAIVGLPIEAAALPLGRYDRRLLAELRRLGYHRVYSSDRRKARATAWLQPRFSVTGTDTPQSLRREALQGPGALGEARSAVKGLIKQLR